MSLDDRLDALERRLGRLERRLALEEAPAEPLHVPREWSRPVEAREPALLDPLPLPPPPPPAPVSAVVFEPPPPARLRPARRRGASGAPAFDLERFLGVAVLGRIGMGAILLAATYFGQLAWKEFGPTAKVATVYGLAVALIALGFVVRTRAARAYVALLWGGGTAALYLAGVLARLRFGIVEPAVAMGMFVGACGVGQALARRARIEVLAVTALAGAFAAPLLAGSPTDARTALIGYLIAVHGWAAFTEARFGWRGARGVGIAGAVVVAASWVAAHGAMDVSTHVHLVVLLLGLCAPEWGRAVAGLPASQGRARGLHVGWIVGALAIFLPAGFVAWAGSAGAGSGAREVLANVLPGLAVVACGLAALARTRVEEPSPASRALARVALATLLPAVWMVFQTRGLPMDTVRTLALASLALVATGALAARVRFGLRDTGAIAAASLGMVTVLHLPAADPRVALALVAPAALVAFGRAGGARTAGFVVGVLAVLASFLRVRGAWSPVTGFAAAAAWIFVGDLLERRRANRALGGALDVARALAAGAWALAAFVGAFRNVPQALTNPGTVAALVLGTLLVVRAPWRADPRRTEVGSVLSGLALFALVGIAGWRELHAALLARGATAAAGAVEPLYVAAGGAFAAWLGRRRAATGFLVLAVGLVAWAIGWAAGVPPGARAPVPVAATLVGLALAAYRVGRSGPDGAAVARLASAVLLGGVVLLARERAAEGAFGAGALVANLRVGAGLALVALLGLARRDARTASAEGLGAVLGAAAVVTFFVTGRLEVLDAVRGVDSGALRSVLVSVFGALVAGGSLAIGLAKRARDLRWTALAGFALVVGKVGFHDLQSVDTPLRILVSGSLGVVLLAAAYAYARRSRPDASPVG